MLKKNRMKKIISPKWLLGIAILALLISCSSVRKPIANYCNYQNIMNGDGNELMDLRSRTALLQFVELFRTAYNRKDIELLAKIYNDSALIYNPGKQAIQTKKKYIKYLRSVFNKNDKIIINFDNIKLAVHPNDNDIYGVELIQSWNTTHYSNVGFLFLLIDFKDGKNMRISKQCWQPEKLSGEPLSDEKKFKLGDFDIRPDK